MNYKSILGLLVVTLVIGGIQYGSYITTKRKANILSEASLKFSLNGGEVRQYKCTLTGVGVDCNKEEE